MFNFYFQLSNSLAMQLFTTKMLIILAGVFLTSFVLWQNLHISLTQQVSRTSLVQLVGTLASETAWQLFSSIDPYAVVSN